MSNLAQKSNRQKTMKDIDGGPHPTIDGQSRRWQDDIARNEGTTWNRKAIDRRQWLALIKGYIQQWMDKA